MNTVKRHHSGKRLVPFGPEKRRYRNKIMHFVIKLDDSVKDKIKLLRLNSKPVVDYMFIGNKLYCILENWGVISSSKLSSLKQRLRRKYGRPSVKRTGKLHTVTWKKASTKAVLYYRQQSSGRYKSKLYIYSTDIFVVLFSQ